MEPAESIVRLGFRRWYERQLIESHAYLVTGFLCLIVVLASVEDFNLRAPGFKPLIMLALIIGAGLLGYFACMRYFTMLAYAEHIAGKSTCEKCNAHAAFTVTGSGSGQPAAADEETRSSHAWFAVKCRKCGHQWTIS
jgi:ribosomal protein L40E